MAVRVSGKTINELDIIENVTGEELIPIAVKDQDTGKYSTVSITLDNFLKMVTDKINENTSMIKAVGNYAYMNVNDLNEKTAYNMEAIEHVDSRMTAELTYTNINVAYNAEAIVRLGINLDEIDNESDSNFSYIIGTIGDLAAYTHSGFAYNDMFDAEQQRSIEMNTYVNAYQQGDINDMKVLHDNPWESIKD